MIQQNKRKKIKVSFVRYHHINMQKTKKKKKYHRPTMSIISPQGKKTPPKTVFNSAADLSLKYQMTG